MPHELREALRRAGVAEDRMDAILAALPRPDASNWNPDPTYLRELLDRASASQRAAAELLGINPRQFRYFCAGKLEIPYTAQYALEMLAELNSAENNRKPQSGDDDDR